MHEIIYRRLMSNAFGPRSVEVYGSAYHITKRDDYTIAEVAKGMLNAITEAKYWTPNIDSKTVAHRYCGLFLIDPMLMETFLGVRF